MRSGRRAGSVGRPVVWAHGSRVSDRRAGAAAGSGASAPPAGRRQRRRRPHAMRLGAARAHAARCPAGLVSGQRRAGRRTQLARRRRPRAEPVLGAASQPSNAHAPRNERAYTTERRLIIGAGGQRQRAGTTHHSVAGLYTTHSRQTSGRENTAYSAAVTFLPSSVESVLAEPHRKRTCAHIQTSWSASTRAKVAYRS